MGNNNNKTLMILTLFSFTITLQLLMSVATCNVHLWKRVHDSLSVTRLHARIPNAFTEFESRFV